VLRWLRSTKWDVFVWCLLLFLTARCNYVRCLQSVVELCRNASRFPSDLLLYKKMPFSAFLVLQQQKQFCNFMWKSNVRRINTRVLCRTACLISFQFHFWYDPNASTGRRQIKWMGFGSLKNHSSVAVEGFYNNIFILWFSKNMPYTPLSPIHSLFQSATWSKGVETSQQYDQSRAQCASRSGHLKQCLSCNRAWKQRGRGEGKSVCEQTLL